MREIAEIVAGYAQVAGHCARGRVRRDRAAVLALLDRARLPVPGDQPARPTIRRRRSRTGPACCCEIVAAVRDAIGPGRALGVRLCGDELIDGGTTIDEAVEVARIVEATGQVRLHQHLDRGRDGDALHDRGVDARAARVRAVHPVGASARRCDLPVVGVGRFKDPLQAERALAEGHCDLVGVVRGQIADADFARQGPLRARRGHPAVPVVQPGVRRADGPEPLARLHREPAHRPRGDRAPQPRPHGARRAASWSSARARPGCRPAITAARRGHQVTRATNGRRGRRPGPAGRDASRAGPSSAISSATSSQSCARLGVEITYGADVDAATVRAAAPDAVIVATGADRRAAVLGRRPMPAAGRRRPATCWTDRRRRRAGSWSSTRSASTRRPAWPSCWPTAARTSRWSPRHGRRTGSRDHARPGALEHPGRGQGHRPDHRLRWSPRSRPAAVHPAAPPHGTDQADRRRLGRAAPFPPRRPNSSTCELKALGQPGLHRVGDCVAPRRAHAAVIEGQRAGEAL